MPISLRQTIPLRDERTVMQPTISNAACSLAPHRRRPARDEFVPRRMRVEDDAH